MGLSTIGELRPLEEHEQRCYQGIGDYASARIAVGSIEDIPFEMVVESDTVQLHCLLEGDELITYAYFGQDARCLALDLVEAVRQGDLNLEELALVHKLEMMDYTVEAGDAYKAPFRGRANA